MEEEDFEWEEWNPKNGSFVHHMVAGSIAGIAEHTVMFPVDTIKTHVQCERCTTSSKCLQKEVAGSLSSALRLVQEQGLMRLWRGVSTMFSGCVPAHAAYFTILESMKQRLGVNEPGYHPLQAAIAGAMATVSHDSIITPMDVIKQRLQLGYYKGMLHCASSIWQVEGIRAFYLSFPITLFMNIPYGCVMVATNETLKHFLSPSGNYSVSTYILAGCGAGAVAAAATTPLDLIKTRLQTQVILHHDEAPGSHSLSSRHQHQAGARPPSAPIHAHTLTAKAIGIGSESGQGQPVRHHVTAGSSPNVGCIRAEKARLKYKGILDAARQIHAEEGLTGFFRGMGPRLLVHTPSVAISWTTYETIKKLLADRANSASQS